jgi:hypothetical protein
LMDPARVGSETPRTIFDFLEDLDRINSNSAFRWSFRIPVDYRGGIRIIR